jgi:flagellar biosynthesis/type III secretory pathway protein FliH
MISKKPTSSESVPAAPAGEKPVVAPFVYKPAPGWNDAKQAAAASAIVAAGAAVASVTAVAQETSLIDEDARLREKQAWESGFREGLAKGRSENEAAVLQLRESVSAALSDFSRERQSYFLHVEGEIVSLALAIVRKILHRESEVDPLLLTGLVRVALEKMSSSQNVRLLVHPSHLRAWQDYFFGRSDLPLVPECVTDSTLALNQCRIETDHGVTDLHIEAQLKEIEQGLFDLLAQRPEPK